MECITELIRINAHKTLNTFMQLVSVHQSWLVLVVSYFDGKDCIKSAKVATFSITSSVTSILQCLLHLW